MGLAGDRGVAPPRRSTPGSPSSSRLALASQYPCARPFVLSPRAARGGDGRDFSMLRVGFIGAGTISDENARGYLDCADATIVAVCDPDEARARSQMRRWNLPEAAYHGDYEQMLDREALDIVEILTPHHLHCAQAVRSAQAGVKG